MDKIAWQPDNSDSHFPRAAFCAITNLYQTSLKIENYVYVFVYDENRYIKLKNCILLM